MLGRELKVGMMTTFGVVLEVHHEGDYPDGIYEGPHIGWMEVQNPYFGACTSTLQMDDEYTILFEQGTPQYRKAVKNIIKERSSILEDVQKDITNLLEFV